MECTDHINIHGSINAYASLLRECLRMKSLQEGKRVHAHIIIDGLDMDLILANHVVDMYSKCGSVVEARHAFDRMPEHNVFSWMAILSAYANHGLANEVLKSYERMQGGSVVPDKFIFVTVLKACAGLSVLDCGQNAHLEMIKTGIDMDVFVQSTLINMYIKCGSIDDACHTFNDMSEHNVVSWNAMISGYVQQGYPEEAAKLFEEMQQEGVIPDKVTFVGALQVCASMRALEKAQQLHIQLVKLGFNSDLTVSNTLIDTYAKCESIHDAWEVFASITERDVVSWNVIIAAHVQPGSGEKAISLYQQMQQEAIKPNEATFVSILKACTILGDLERGKQFHKKVMKEGFKLNTFLASALVNMYAKCKRLEDAYEVFSNVEEKNVVVWTAMIAGYAQQGLGKEALSLYQRMEQSGLKPNEATLISILKACTSLGSVERGLQIYDQIRKSNLKTNTLVMNSLVEMYANCGSIDDAHLAFNEMSERDVVSWTAMIGGYAQQGLVKEALTLFEQMLKEGVKPNAVTFVSILSACSHAGLIDAGCHYFYSMTRDHGIIPTSDHCACMVDLLGRAGHLEEAADLITNMQTQPTELVWRTLLGACRTFSNEALANYAAEQILQLNPDNDAAYVLLSNMYGASSSCTEALELNELGMEGWCGFRDNVVSIR